MKARIDLDATTVAVDLERPISLAREVSFGAGDARFFGAAPAVARPLVLPEFPGRVDQGGSCNCSTLTLTPHCHGTHTECVGHLTREPLDAWRLAPPGWLWCELVSVLPQLVASPGTTPESSDPPPRPGDHLVTRRALLDAWPERTLAPARALVLRTRESTGGSNPPYFSREAAQLLVERGIEHLVVDLPSLDRTHDAGRLTAHRLFFGLPPRTSELARATRARCTVTELAHIPETVRDGSYLLELQVPAIAGDAVPSRPLLFALAGSIS